MTDPVPARSSQRRAAVWIVLLLLIVAAASGALWLARERVAYWLHPAAADAERAAVQARLEALENRLGEQVDLLHQMADRVSGNVSAQRVIRDDLLGIGERAALLEEAIGKMAESHERDGIADLLRLDQVEMLLIQAQWRLQYGHDRSAALAAYALAESAMAQLSAPQYVSLRQSLAQEHAAMAAAEDRYSAAVHALDGLERSLAGLPETAAPGEFAPAGRLARMLDRLVQVRRSDERLVLAADAREHVRLGLALELALARAALERNDEAGFRAALGRVGDAVQRLYPDGGGRAELMAGLASLAKQPLAPELPLLGSSVEQLRQLRAGLVVAGGRR